MWVGVDMQCLIHPYRSSLHMRSWLTQYWLILPNPKTNCQYRCLRNAKPGSDCAVMDTILENGGRSRCHLRAADESTLPLKNGQYVRNLSLLLRRNNYLNIFQRWEELSQQLGWALQRARAAGSGYNWAEIGLPWQWYFVQSNALQWLADRLSHSPS